MSSGSWYMVVRCVPDTLAGEFVNVGVIAWEEDRSQFHCRFTDDLSRAKALGLTGDGEFLFNFFADIRGAIERLPTSRDAYQLEKDLRRMQGWAGLIQCTGWAGSTGSAEETLESVVKLFMKSAVR